MSKEPNTPDNNTGPANGGVRQYLANVSITKAAVVSVFLELGDVAEDDIAEHIEKAARKEYDGLHNDCSIQYDIEVFTLESYTPTAVDD